VELRLNDKFGVEPDAGQPGVGLAGAAGRAQRPGLCKEKGQLTVTYLTDAHRAAAKQIVR
jgi:N-carbamoyl-L-amino-acid hydrolase